MPLQQFWLRFYLSSGIARSSPYGCCAIATFLYLNLDILWMATKGHPLLPRSQPSCCCSLPFFTCTEKMMALHPLWGYLIHRSSCFFFFLRLNDFFWAALAVLQNCDVVMCWSACLQIFWVLHTFLLSLPKESAVTNNRWVPGTQNKVTFSELKDWGKLHRIC